MPVWGECGGLVYLSRSLETDGRSHRMCGVLPADSAMTPRHPRARVRRRHLRRGPASGHSTAPAFAATSSTTRTCSPDADARYALALSRGRGLVDGQDGLCEHATVAGYTHAYFSDRFCSAFVDAARAFARR